jgi:predicted regulator of Ras-like GTPase activity (Roadblock/LC7/MglB family)
MPSKKKNLPSEPQEQNDQTPKIDEKTEAANARATLEHIKSRGGVIGYIIRGPTSASVDVKDPSKIIDYAVLSSAALQSSEGLSDLFELGKISNIVLEGKTLKMLSLTKGEQRISVFMDKGLDHNSIYKEIE